MSMKNRPIEIGLTQIIGPDDVAVAVNQYSSTADLDFGQTYGATQVRPVSGEIQSIILVATETGTGAPPDEPGWLFFLDADPNTTSGDALLALAEHGTILGQVRFAAADWNVADAGGATAYKQVAIPFHSLRWIYVVFRNLGGAINSAAGDNEELHINVWYRRDD